MRLNSIKLSGFKSFVEPTHFVLPGQRVGVVGPNGCGKSNIMDAVRWVLGESRASELRGESMQDVIFNGTTLRKPASRASVELVFDNADHRAGGQWSQFAEIAVKRVLTRDGTSSYYINNQPVRRRDVQDVFLGTGLGPRAYAIIGQGTISRIIESKPEELRLFLEEAAGVSKYKERRRETENRLADTRENLTRVHDILRELNVNLDKLEKQAEVAQRYKQLQAAATQRQHQFWYLRREENALEQTRLSQQVQQAVNELEARMAELRHVQSELEQLRQAHYTAGDQVNQAQGLLYEASAELGRLEAEIRFVVQTRERTVQRIAQLDEQSEQWAQRQSEALSQAQTEAQRGEQAQQLAVQTQQQLTDHGQQHADLQRALQQAQAAAQEQRASVAQIQQHIQVLATEQRHIAEQTRQFSLRRDKLSADQRGLSTPDEEQLQRLQAQLLQARESAAQAQTQLQALQEQVPQIEAQRREHQQQVNAQSATQADLSARLAALKALQDKVKTDGKLKPWLVRHGLQDLAALWSQLHIEPGWESALEAALRERLHALHVGRLDSMSAFAGDPPPAKLAFYSMPSAGAAQSSGARAALADLLRTGDASLRVLLTSWLHGCYTADSIEQAMAERAHLQAGEVIYVKAGHAVSSHGVSFYAADSEQAGLLARAQEIENLGKQLRAQELLVEQARNALSRSEAAQQQIAEQLTRSRAEAAQCVSRAHTLEVQTLQLTQQAEQVRTRSAQITQDLAEIHTQLEQLQTMSVQASARFEALDMQLADSQEREAQLQDRAMQAQAQVSASLEQQRQMERQLQEAQFAQRTAAQRLQELQRSADTAAQQLQAVAAEAQSAQQELAQLTDAAAQAGLQTTLALKLEREQVLGQRRSQYDDLTRQLRACDERRLQLELALQPQRESITQLQLKEQAARLGQEQYSQWLTDAQADVQALAQSIQEQGVKLSGLQAEIDRMQRDIAALGAVNLAALEELGSARERKQFLDAQSADLQEAMTTLENAIRKIDGETRTLLSDTFDTVNLHFGRMFPELFGGGQAKLTMTGDEILDSGVQVMAQPPGKKNQTIHLLSGGEKALTAIALVFAIFQLNPAPFCLLDEVDAPLDDANTERYAKLVTRMSEETQFLFISHNKIAMEMAQQLIGVTMQEQGVSRIVAVDMEAAVSLTQAA